MLGKNYRYLRQRASFKKPEKRFVVALLFPNEASLVTVYGKCGQVLSYRFLLMECLSQNILLEMTLFLSFRNHADTHDIFSV